MDRSNVIYLISTAYTQNALKQYVYTTEKRLVYCSVSSISQTEWFEGGRNGLNPQLRFTMFAPDYQGEKELEFEGVVYSIYRTYVGKNEFIDLYTELKKGTEYVNTVEDSN